MKLVIIPDNNYDREFFFLVFAKLGATVSIESGKLCISGLNPKELISRLSEAPKTFEEFNENDPESEEGRKLLLGYAKERLKCLSEVDLIEVNQLISNIMDDMYIHGNVSTSAFLMKFINE